MNDSFANPAMARSAPRSIDQYLQQLRGELSGEDAALIQDALYDAEEYLRAEVAAHPDKSETDILEIIASTYGAPDEVAAAYRDTEAKLKAAMAPPRRAPSRGLGAFFGIYLDPRAYTSLFLMLLSLATGIFYFTFALVGLSLSAGFSVLIIGLPFFLAFIGVTRVLSLAEGRLIEATTGARMPRRPLRAQTDAGFWTRVADMLKDRRTWTTLAYLLSMLPLGIAYFVIATVGLSLSLVLMLSPLLAAGTHLGWVDLGGASIQPDWLGSPWAAPLVVAGGALLLTALLHLARGLGRIHAMYAKALLVSPAGPSAPT